MVLCTCSGPPLDWLNFQPPLETILESPGVAERPKGKVDPPALVLRGGADAPTNADWSASPYLLRENISGSMSQAGIESE